MNFVFAMLAFSTFSSSRAVWHDPVNTNLQVRSRRLRGRRIASGKQGGGGGKGKRENSSWSTENDYYNLYTYTYSYNYNDTPPPVEQIVMEPSGSNDQSHLEHICTLFAESQDFELFDADAADATVCDFFEGFQSLMCPNLYETQNICTAATSTSSVSIYIVSNAITEEYCQPLFAPLVNNASDYGVDNCMANCKLFVSETACCDIPCRN